MGRTLRSSITGRGERFDQPQHPDRLWDSPSLVLNRYGGSFPWANRLAREINHSPASSAEVENEWSYSPFPCKPLWHGQGKLYLYLVYTLACLIPNRYDARFHWPRELRFCIMTLHIPCKFNACCSVHLGSKGSYCSQLNVVRNMLSK
jgi:hypothetical protein